ncbi:hypothetical protein AL036_20500 [Salipiger aestuarii]|uniref:hypothetical protein n=1 Tax=Salipiger aestuarii TaxID=568098 RepID=UPI00123AFD51|nr:hypothetical protein [Salipiger aestuarii]KAA8605138.1 hypothetical protein AL036_20500 [Salipiger aestuarii]
MKHEDNFESFVMRINPPRKYTPQDAAQRPYPRFADLMEFTEGESFKASIPAVLRTWWIVGIVAIIGLWVIFVPVGFGLSFVAATWERGGYFNPLPLLITIGVLLVVSYGILRAVFPRIIVHADREKITVGKFRYSWDYAQGLRAGYSVGGVEKDNKQWKFAGLRMAYGQWSHDLPYMVNDYYSAAYIVWVNQLLETIQVASSAVNDIQAGKREILY